MLAGTVQRLDNLVIIAIGNCAVHAKAWAVHGLLEISQLELPTRERGGV